LIGVSHHSTDVDLGAHSFADDEADGAGDATAIEGAGGTPDMEEGCNPPLRKRIWGTWALIA
jgi:hypothetical protein